MSKDNYELIKKFVKPLKLKDIIGQEGSINFLNNCLLNDFFPQALMFYGPYGVGKTATARLYCKAINCLGKDKPCYSCEACSESLDFYEYNSSHYSKIDDIKDMIKGVRYRPMKSRFKIYLLDEVHMLTSKSFNTLLKEIEDAPSYVKFLGITTNIESIPEVFLSRFVLMEFNSVRDDDLYNYLIGLLDRALGNDAIRDIFRDKNLQLIVEASGGSVRKAIHSLVSPEDSNKPKEIRILFELKIGFMEGIIAAERLIKDGKSIHEIALILLKEIAEELIEAWNNKKEAKINVLNDIFLIVNSLLGQRFLKKESLICCFSKISSAIKNARKK